MKKILITLALVATFSFSSYAQNWLTVKGGGGIGTNLGYSRNVNAGVATNFGLGYKHQISKRMMLEGDLLLDSRVSDFYTGFTDIDEQPIYFSTAATYIQVPIILQYKIPFKKKELVPYRMGQPKSYWFIEGGPHLAYGLNVTSYNDSLVLDQWADQDSDTFTTKDLTPRNFDLGVTVGVGINFSLGDEGKRRLIIGTRANYGFINLYRDNRLGVATNFSAVGYIALDISLTSRKHIKHRW